MEKINTKRLKAKLKTADYEKIIKSLDIPIYSKGSKYWTLYTGCHHKNPYDGSPKLLFYPDTGMFQCLTQCSCSFDIISLVQRRLSLVDKTCSFIKSVRYILNLLGLEIDNIKRLTKPNVCNWQESMEQFIRFRQLGTSLADYDKAILSDLDTYLPLTWINEGISVDTMRKYQIGYYERSQCTTIPCFDKEGRLIGIRCRHWDPEQIEQGKYRPLTLLDGTTYKFSTNAILYGINWNWPEIERTETVILGESEKLVLKLDTWYHEKSVALGMYGSVLGLRQRNQLIKMGVKKVIFVLDNDWVGKDDIEWEKWRNKILRQAEMFKGYASVDLVWDNLGLLGPKDNATDGNRETWERLYESREQDIF